jgi:hypothetical protein
VPAIYSSFSLPLAFRCPVRASLPALASRHHPHSLRLSLVGRVFYQPIEHASTTREFAPITIVLPVVIAAGRGDVQIAAPRLATNGSAGGKPPAGRPTSSPPPAHSGKSAIRAALISRRQLSSTQSRRPSDRPRLHNPRRTVTRFGFVHRPQALPLACSCSSPAGGTKAQAACSPFSRSPKGARGARGVGPRTRFLEGPSAPAIPARAEASPGSPMMPGHFLSLLFTLFAPFTGSDPAEASSGDNGAGLELNG